MICIQDMMGTIGDKKIFMLYRSVELSLQGFPIYAFLTELEATLVGACLVGEGRFCSSQKSMRQL